MIEGLTGFIFSLPVITAGVGFYFGRRSARKKS